MKLLKKEETPKRKLSILLQFRRTLQNLLPKHMQELPIVLIVYLDGLKSCMEC